MLLDKYELRYLPLFHEELKERALYIANNYDPGSEIVTITMVPVRKLAKTI